MNDGTIELIHSGDNERHGTLYSNYTVKLCENGVTVGVCNLRQGGELVEYAGNIGYEIDEPFRGHRYAVRAVRLLCERAEELGMKRVLICCTPENEASRRVCELCGAVYDRTVRIPENSSLYAYGKRESCRYIINLVQNDNRTV